jgi:hypothetical protein
MIPAQLIRPGVRVTRADEAHSSTTVFREYLRWLRIRTFFYQYELVEMPRLHRYEQSLITALQHAVVGAPVLIEGNT